MSTLADTDRAMMQHCRGVTLARDVQFWRRRAAARRAAGDHKDAWRCAHWARGYEERVRRLADQILAELAAEQDGGSHATPARSKNFRSLTDE